MALGFVGLDPSASGLYDQYTQDYQERMARFRRANEYYEGKFKPPLKLIVNPNGTTIDDNVYINHCRPTVDKGVDFLFGKGLRYKINNLESSDEETYLTKVLKSNKQEIMLRKIALNGAIFGHVFIRLMLPNPGYYGHEYPRIIVLNPEEVYVEWDMHDVERVRRYIIQYATWNPDERKIQTFRHTIETIGNDQSQWQIKEEVANEQRYINMPSGMWRLIRTTRWPYPFCPIVSCQNLPAPNQFWGTADLMPDLLDLQDSINFTLSNIARILRYHAHPKTWGSGFNAQQVANAVNEITVLPKDGKLENLEMQSDLASSIGYLTTLRNGFYTISRTPKIAVEPPESMTNLSGAAIALMLEPLIDKTEQKRATYGEMHVMLGQHLLMMGGYEESDDLMSLWPDMLTPNPAELTATLEQQVGNRLVSRKSASKKLGYNADQEAAQIEKEQMSDQKTQLRLTKAQSSIQTDAAIKQTDAQAAHQKDMVTHQANTGLDSQRKQQDIQLEGQKKSLPVVADQQEVTGQIQHDFATQQAQQGFEQQKALAEHQSSLRMQEQAAADARAAALQRQKPPTKPSQ